MATHTEGPGAIRCAPGTHVLNADRTPDERRTVVITNTGDRPVQIGSHVHLPLVNAALDFDRDAAEGFRLDVPPARPSASSQVRRGRWRSSRCGAGAWCPGSRCGADG